MRVEAVMVVWFCLRRLKDWALMWETPIYFVTRAA